MTIDIGPPRMSTRCDKSSLSQRKREDHVSRSPSLKDARRYIRLVKRELGSTSPRYHAFLNLLRVYRSKGVKPQDVIERVNELFDGHESLLKGFMKYVPKGFDSDDNESHRDGGRPTENLDTDLQIFEKNETPHDEGETIQDIPNTENVRLPTKHGQQSQSSAVEKRKMYPKVILSPLPSAAKSSSLLFNQYDPLSEQGIAATAAEFVICKLCKGQRHAEAVENNEPILLCEQKGCNAEYHFKCLPPSLFGLNVSGEQIELTEIPSGDIYCKECATDGSTAVLRQYFERCDYIRSFYSCSRAYVLSLLERQMKESLPGNVSGMGENSTDVGPLVEVWVSGDVNPSGVGSKQWIRLKPPPQSELWHIKEMNRVALLNPQHVGTTDDKQEVSQWDDDWNDAEFLIGKPIRLYCHLDNEYHNGRIVDWRTCSAYPAAKRERQVKYLEGDTVHIDDLDYYGSGIVSSCEFLVRFPSGVDGRKKELLKWIILEEHSLVVGITLVQGQTHGLKTRVRGWKPAMVLARSALELVPVREFLHEGPQGELFGTMIRAEMDSSSGETKQEKQVNEKVTTNELWALTSFFGGDTYAVLNLNQEVQDLIPFASNNAGTSFSGKSVCEDDPKAHTKRHPSTQTASVDTESEDDVIQNIFDWHPSSSVPVKLGLALVEYDEQRRCKDWYMTVLHNPKHSLALTSADEYSMELALRNETVGLTEQGIENANHGLKIDIDRNISTDEKTMNMEAKNNNTLSAVQIDKTISSIKIPDGKDEIFQPFPLIGLNWCAHLIRRKVEGESVIDRFFISPSGERYEVSTYLKKIMTMQQNSNTETEADQNTTIKYKGTVRRGVDRLYLAQLVDNISPPLERSRDCLMSLENTPVNSPSETMPFFRNSVSQNKECCVNSSNHDSKNYVDSVNEETKNEKEIVLTSQGTIQDGHDNVDKHCDNDVKIPIMNIDIEGNPCIGPSIQMEQEEMDDEIEEEYDDNIYEDYAIAESSDEESFTSERLTSNDFEGEYECHNKSGQFDVGKGHVIVGGMMNPIQVTHSEKRSHSHQQKDKDGKTEQNENNACLTPKSAEDFKTDVKKCTSDSFITLENSFNYTHTKFIHKKTPKNNPASLVQKLPSWQSSQPGTFSNKDTKSESEDDDMDTTELPRGITMRPSGKWQAQLYYAGKSRYLGVFRSKKKACLAHEIARQFLRTQQAQSATLVEDINQNICIARKLAHAC